MKKLGPILFCLLLLSGCSSDTPPPKQITPNAHTLKQLQHLQPITPKDGSVANISDVRYGSLREMALTVGAQTGLAYRSEQINAMLNAQTNYLDSIFNFNQLLLPHNIMPPVLVEANNTFNLAGPQVIRVADKSYTVVSQAHFVSTAPNWRQYLLMSFPKPVMPPPSVLPKTPAEETVWKKFVTLGWGQGIKQANAIYDENLGRLKRDFTGAILYRRLVTQNMISQPFVASSNLGITGDGHKMNLGDTVTRITALPQLNLDSGQWAPAIAGTHGGPAAPLQQQANLDIKGASTHEQQQPLITK